MTTKPKKIKRIKKCKKCGIAGNKWFYTSSYSLCKECQKRKQKDDKPRFKKTYDFSQPIELELSRADELRMLYNN